ncbi:MAG TPA: TolC family protein [Verrucomicrobiota bacterium]|nr:TolC family protein [Verrucomicrobiota bacterium]
MLAISDIRKAVTSLAILGAMLANVEAEQWTLQRALSHALTNSPDARIAQQRITAARAVIDQANSALWPQLQFKSTYVRTDNPVMVFGSLLNQRSIDLGTLDFNNVPDVDNLNVRGVVSMPIYTGGQITAARKGATANAESIKQDARAVRNTLGFEVARAYHTIMKARGFVRATEAAVASYENNVAIARKRHEAGTMLKSDVLAVEVRLAQAREDLVRARNGLALATRALRSLIGVDDESFEVAEDAPSVEVPSELDFSGRPELASLEQKRRAAEAAVQGAKSGYLPKVGVFGSLDYDHGWRFNGDGGSWTAGAMLEWNLWDGKATRARVNEARANLEMIDEHDRKLRLGLDLEVEQARLGLKEADERLEVTSTVIAQAEESVQLTRARFEQGLALATQLIDAETALTAARVRRAEAEADRNIAIAALRKALGLPQLDLPDLNP